MILWRITCPKACAGVLVSASGRIVKTAPYFNFMRGMSIQYVRTYYGRRPGWTVEPLD